jgi:DNA-binding transcriptional MerR regulator
MNSARSDDEFVTIGEAAREWRVSPDSLRSWARKGKLHPIPTPGGWRRFSRRELISVLGDPQATSSVESSAKQAASAARTQQNQGNARQRRSRASRHFIEGSASPEVDIALEDLKITRAQRETESLRHQMEEEDRQAAERAQADQLRREEERRIEDLRAYGRSMASLLPDEWRQRVITMLQTEVNAESIPRSLSTSDAEALVDAKVQEIRRQFRAQGDRENKEAGERRRVQELASMGLSVAILQTSSWDSRDAADARAEIARELEQHVQPAWSVWDVERKVEEILGQWDLAEDEGTEDDADDDADFDDALDADEDDEFEDEEMDEDYDESDDEPYW